MMDLEALVVAAYVFAGTSIGSLHAADGLR